MAVTLVGARPQKFHSWESHSHDLWEIVLNAEGTGTTRIGGVSYPFAEGTIICQPPGISHEKFSQDGFRDIFLQTTYFPLSGKVDKNGVLLCRDDAAKSFETLMCMANQLFHQDAPNCKNTLQALLDAMLQLLIGWQETVQENAEVARMKNRMIQSFTDPDFSVSVLWEDAPLSKDHLRRKFIRETGCTPLRFLTDLRVEFAKKLLCGNSALHYSIAEIGMMSGYYDNHYFSRLFKQKTGLSPLEYAAEEKE